MQNASVVVVPSLSETFGLIILEAWGAGAPVISSRTSGALSLVKEEENGHLFSIENEDEFHHGLDRILGDRDHGMRMAESGHRLSAEEYDTAILSRRIKALYEDIIREKA